MSTSVETCNKAPFHSYESNNTSADSEYAMVSQFYSLIILYIVSEERLQMESLGAKFQDLVSLY